MKISDLYEFEDDPPTHKSPDLASITPYVLRQFQFLPQPLVVTIESDEVVVAFPKGSSAASDEAKRLAEKAAKRAAEGNYGKAIAIFKRVLELDPTLYVARRDLAMACMETGDVESAVNHLIEVLRLNSNDTWSWVVLANLYIREKADPETGEKFLRKALSLKPDDAWALNSLAAVCLQNGNPDEALAQFEKAIQANPEFANPYYGMAQTYDSKDQPLKAEAILKRLFSNAAMQDVRSRQVYEAARELFVRVESNIASLQQSDAFKFIQSYKAEAEALSGYPVRIEEGEFKDGVGARIQMAWKHRRDYHLITTRQGFPPELMSHLQAHELTHLMMESKARRKERNLFFATTAETRESVLRSIAPDLKKWQKAGYSENSITEVALSMTTGLCGFLFNCPLDMVIESHIRESFAVLHSSQFLSVRVMANEAWSVSCNPEVRKLTPRKIMNASLALNGAFGLFLDGLFEGASTFALPYTKLETFSLSQRLLNHFNSKSAGLDAGDEYQLVDDFAEMLGLEGWYEWKQDPGTHEVNDSPDKQGATNPTLLKEKHPACVFYFLDIFKRFDEMTLEQIRAVAFEAALVGRDGLDYSSPDEKYELRSLPGKRCSGLYMMCLMYAGFKRIAPDQDLGMDLNDPFLTALQLHKHD